MTALRFRLTIPLDYPKIEVDGWRTRALCAQRVKAGTAEAWWFDDKVGVDDVREDPPSRRRRMARARAVCAQCPVLQSCLADVEPANDTGMRGGVDLRDLWDSDKRVGVLAAIAEARDAVKGKRGDAA